MRKKLLTLSLGLLSSMMIVGCSHAGYRALQRAFQYEEEPLVCAGSDGPVYRVYFYDSQNNGEQGVKYVVQGNKLEKPDDPTAANRDFVGWYTTRKCVPGTEYDFNKAVNSNFVLYAKYEARKISDEDVARQNQKWLDQSLENHLYIHYLRFTNKPEEYAKYDVWAWSEIAEGHIFDFVKDNDGNVVVDELSGAYVDIDLNQTYAPAGWMNGHYISDLELTYKKDGELVKHAGFQIVESSTREDLESYWANDGDDNNFKLEDAKWDNGSYHLFLIQNNVPNFTYRYTNESINDPYADDYGDNVSVSNINSSAAGKYGKAQTATDFLNESGIGYQIMVASFADSDNDGKGDLLGITKKLQYLKDTLHINTLWLTPVQLSNSYHGYDTIDYKVVDPKFGSSESPHSYHEDPTEESAMKDYEDLIKEADRLNIRVVMDLVLNHTSKKNVWFLKSAQLDPEYRSFYQWKNHEVTPGIKNNKYWHQYSTSKYSYYAKFASSMPELNYDYQGTRDAIVDVAEFWLDKGVSGFRIDAVKHVYMADEVDKASGDTIIKEREGDVYASNLTKNLNFFKEFNARVKAKNPNALILGENFDGNAINNVAPYYEGLDSLFDFYTYYKISNIAISNSSGNGARAKDIANSGSDKWNIPGVLSVYDQYRGGEAIDAPFTSNHDVPRVVNMMIGTVANSDDQSAGTVTSGNASTAIKKAKAYATVMTMLKGTTWIYYGDELGMSSNFGLDVDGNPENLESPYVDRWYRQPYKFTPGLSGTLDNDGVYQTGFNFVGGGGFAIGYDEYNKTIKSAQEQIDDENSILYTYNKLTELKSSHKALIRGSYEGISNQDTLFAFKRSGYGETYYIYVNFGSGPISINATGNVVFSTNGGTKTNLPSCGAIITKA